MGASPSFFPLPFVDRASAQEGLRHLVARDPRQFDQVQSRWTTTSLQAVCLWLRDYSRSGIWRLLDEWDIQWKRGRQHVHSPDPAYLAKLARIDGFRALVRQDPTQQILLFQDEVTYYRQPTVGYSYERAGRPQPLAELAYRANTPTRVVATLNFLTGQVSSLQASRIGVQQLVRFYEALAQQYPGARRIYLVQDNWPVHFHPDVLAALEPQESPFPWVYPPNWPTEPSPRARRLGLPIQLLPLPTYASWTNPIEKLWRWLKHDVLHLHRWAHDLLELRRQVLLFLERFADGSDDLLRYVGLLVPK